MYEDDNFHRSINSYLKLIFLTKEIFKYDNIYKLNTKTISVIYSFNFCNS